MAAVAHPAPTGRLRPVSPPAPPATFRRRRAAAAAIAAAVVVSLPLSVAGVLRARDRGPGPVPGPVYVVQPGDTFWDIARTLRPGGDPRPVVTRLVAAHGGAVLVPGERVTLADRS